MPLQPQVLSQGVHGWQAEALRALWRSVRLLRARHRLLV